MRLVQYHDHALELSWTWLPYWLVVGPALKRDIESVIADALVLNQLPLTEENLDKIDAFVIRQFVARFPKIKGLREYLEALHHVEMPE